MIRESLYFQKISSCLCPSSLPLEIVLFKQTYLPSDQIEVMFLIEKTRKLLKSVEVNLVMDLAIFSLTEPPHKVDTVQQVLY
jgi:hypothetical protein